VADADQISNPNASVPNSAKQRLHSLRSAAHPSAVFTSDLSVNEFLLVRKAGFEPIGLCVGSCIYHVGIQYSSWKSNQELEVLSQAMYHARELAMTRMREEAKQMGADGVVGVRLEIKHLPMEGDILEFVAIGTGIVHGEGHAGFRAHDGGPFTSDLSGQDFYTLLQSGYRPIEMVMGSCVYHIARRGFMQSMAQAGQNVELENFTQALYTARELAMERMQTEAQTAKAEGVIGTEIHEKSHRWESHVIEFFAVGTAITPLTSEIASENIPAPQFVLSVNN
jgi:uncharacterized protein YbjQ (UPF0145 family)